MTRPVILASSSSIRNQLLSQAGVDFQKISPDLDEQTIKKSMLGQGATSRMIAAKLAEEKALHVACAHKANSQENCLVIGADQVLDIQGTSYDKPQDLQEAGAQLRALQGKTHTLATALCVAQGSRVIWHHLSEPRLTMRSLSHAFIEAYLARNGPDILSSVGAYQLEGEGAQLFDRLEGDYFAILGLPLLPLLDMLRGEGVLAT